MDKTKVLLIYRGFIPSVYLCGYAQLDYLSNRGVADYRARLFTEVKKEDILWADVVFFIRSDSRQEVWYAKQCRAAGKYTVYILDDDLLNIPQYLSSRKHYENPLIRRQMTKLMDICDCFASPSKTLLAAYKDRFSHTFSIEEPSVVQIGKKAAQTDGKVHIGFAGSIDRGKDVNEILGEAVEEILFKYPNRVTVEIFGPETEFSKRLNIKTYPYRDSYADYQALMKKLNWDIGLAPMPDTPFHRCKHYNKLVEYSGFGIVGVYSNLLPYKGAVKNGVNGMLCENTKKAWVDAISRLVEDDAARKAMQENCLKEAKQRFSVSVTAMQLYSELQKCPIHSGTKNKMLPFYEIRRGMMNSIDFGKRAWHGIIRRIKALI